MTLFADIADLSEDDRIETISRAVRAGNTIGVSLEKDLTLKIARYIRKVTERFPEAVVLDRIDGPVPGVVTIKFGLRPQ